MVSAEITAIKPPSSTESPYPLTLAQTLLKGKKMDLIMQKATELGVDHLIPVTTQYCENKNISEKQIDRWQRIMLEACKQCHRTSTMSISPPLSLEKIDFNQYRHRLLAYENEQNTLPVDVLNNQPGPICLLIGPEGGWHKLEVEYLTNNHFIPFSLGTSILRSETASIAAIATVNYLASIQ